MPHVMETLQGSSTIGRLYVFFFFCFFNWLLHACVYALSCNLAVFFSSINCVFILVGNPFYILGC